MNFENHHFNLAKKCRSAYSLQFVHVMDSPLITSAIRQYYRTFKMPANHDQYFSRLHTDQ